MRKNRQIRTQTLPATQIPAKLLGDLRALIETTRQRVAQTVNSGLVTLYWNIGVRIRKDLLQEARGGYGKQILEKLSLQLLREFGPGFGATNLFNMTRFAEVFPDSQIVHTLCGKLSWSLSTKPSSPPTPT